MNEYYESVLEDLSAFADDANEVEIDRRTGQVLLIRGGQEISCRVKIASEGGMHVETDGISIPYRRFLSQNLAHLDIFAQKIIQKRRGVEAFVNSPARLISSSSEQCDGKAVELLDQKCRDASPFSSQVVFITADAGHGKTALLRQYQRERAEAFIAGKDSFLFWHVDLQGRQLVRLSEALMGDLGDLRMSGIWMPTIIRLLRHRLLVLAIDGFDELAAEQGDKDALGALAMLVREMRDKGTIIAASRRTFFDTEDYLKRTRVFRQAVTSLCDFDQLHLMNWRKSEAISFLSKIGDGTKFPSPEVTYDEILAELNGQVDHPMVARPFLLTYLARMLMRYGGTPADFIRRMENPMEGVASVVKAFVDREVKEKWKSKETGEPYLTADQHMQLLAAVAEEMWRDQRERLSIDVIMVIAEMLLDDWGIIDRRQQIVSMIKMHVLLIPPQDAPDNHRGFDHPEFRNYFIAYALADHLKNALNVGAPGTLGRFLAVSQLPDSVARYATGLIDTQHFSISRILETLRNLVDKEWRQNYLHANIGTIVPYLLDGYVSLDRVVFDARLIYSSLVFEGTRLKGVEFRRGQFVHTSFLRVGWEDVRFVDCEFTEVSVDRDASYARVEFERCSINGLRIFQGDEEVGREYSPARVAQTLTGLGIRIISPTDRIEVGPIPDGEGRKLARRVLRIFRRTTGLMDHLISRKFSHEQEDVRQKIIPLMEQYEILRREPFRGGGKPQDRWILARGLDEILRADGGPGDASLVDFWQKVDE